MYITRKEIQELIDQKLGYAQDKYSQDVFKELDLDDDHKDRHLITRRRLYKYFDKYDKDRQKILRKDKDYEGYERYVQSEIKIMIDELDNLLQKQKNRKMQYVLSLQKEVPNIVAEYYYKAQEGLYDDEYERKRIEAILDKKAEDLTTKELEELLEMKTAKLWIPEQ